MSWLEAAADVSNPQSLSNRLRARRFDAFTRFCASIPRPLSILDVGGTNLFWEQRGWADRDDVRIAIVNIEPEAEHHSNIRVVQGDATDLQSFGDNAFDIVFSNSVIEHLFSRENQAKMASEVARVGRAYWIQTPNFWFPVEPHYYLLGWHWLPRNMRVALLQRFRCGAYPRCETIEEAQRNVDEIQLLTRRQLKELFPDASVWGERLFGVVKSWVAYDGFPNSVR